MTPQLYAFTCGLTFAVMGLTGLVARLVGPMPRSLIALTLGLGAGCLIYANHMLQ